jgi:hypothetical protein
LKNYKNGALNLANILGEASYENAGREYTFPD